MSPFTREIHDVAGEHIVRRKVAAFFSQEEEGEEAYQNFSTRQIYVRPTVSTRVNLASIPHKSRPARPIIAECVAENELTADVAIGQS